MGVRARRWMISRVVRFCICATYNGCRIHRSVHIEGGGEIRATDGGSIHIAAGCTIGRGSRIVAKRGVVNIQQDTFIGPNCVLVANEMIVIGKNGLIAEQVTIRDQDHGLCVGDTPFSRQQMTVSPVSIGSNVWLGAKSTVLRGVTIGDNSVIAAHALVRDDVKKGTLAAGVPARVIRSLERDEAGSRDT